MRPTPDHLAAAADGTVPDVVAPGLTVLFCGINPSLYAAATGHHFARPGNRFWPALHRAGFTDRLLAPAEQDRLPAYGLGITNVVARATARAADLATAEYQAGGRVLAAKLATLRPAWLAVLGITAYRAAFGVPDAGVGPAPDPIGTTRVWVLPSPSGLNARWTLPALAAAYGELRAAATA